jgi:PadR family transcriptional regulator PadR
MPEKSVDSRGYFLYYVEAMSKGDYLGEFEQIVLLALLRLGEDAYGMRVRQEIEDRTGRDVSIGAVYATLDRMEMKALVKSSLGEPSAERGGRAKRTFQLTATGRKSLASTQKSLRGMLDGLDQKWGLP